MEYINICQRKKLFILTSISNIFTQVLLTCDPLMNQVRMGLEPAELSYSWSPPGSCSSCSSRHRDCYRSSHRRKAVPGPSVPCAVASLNAIEDRCKRVKVQIL